MMKPGYYFLLMIFLILSFEGMSQNTENHNAFFTDQHCSLSVHFTRYDTTCFNSVIHRIISDNKSDDYYFVFENSTWNIQKKVNPVQDCNGAYDVTITFSCVSGQSPATSVSLDLAFDNWSKDNFVLMPAAVYDGNRVKAVHHPYCPFLFDANDFGPNKPQVISDIPRLNIGEGPSRIQQRTGDMSTPSIGFQNAKSGKGFWLLTEQTCGWGDNGIDIEENNKRTKATITLTAPLVRERCRYFIADMSYPSVDRPANFVEGDSVQLKARLYFFDSPNVQGLYDKFVQVRNDLVPKGNAPAVIPFSATFKIQEEKFNRQNFEPSFGYYSVGLRENCFQDWQIGWTGGMITTYPLYWYGSEQTRKNVIRNFDWLFAGGISPSGYFWDTGEKGNQWFGIFPMIPQAKNLHLVRKSGDGLYFILKQFDLFKEVGVPVKLAWENGTKTVADAFVHTWKEYGQLGQFVDNSTGEIVIGGSTSGAIVPAALVLAANYYHNEEYKTVAKEIAGNYYQEYISRGVTYGGPGDAMQNFDSESSYAMLESFMVLYKETSDAKWLKRAEEMAAQFATWVSSYDYHFPEESTYGMLGKRTTGVVWANTQNKCGAPGICTHSGLALLHLYQCTGNYFYLDLLRDITKALPQYLSTKENPIPGLQTGWISERVSTTDWLEGIGELMHGSTWAETSMLLTIAEIPGIYVDLKRDRVVDFDQVEISDVSSNKNRIVFLVKNPTIYPAKVKLLVDGSAADKTNSQSPFQIITLDPGKEQVVTIKK